MTKEECCFIMEDGISYHTEEGCQNCIGNMLHVSHIAYIHSTFFLVHGFVSDLYEVAEGGTVEVELKINLKGTTMFPFLQVHGVITSDNSTGKFLYLVFIITSYCYKLVQILRQLD